MFGRRRRGRSRGRRRHCHFRISVAVLADVVLGLPVAARAVLDVQLRGFGGDAGLAEPLAHAPPLVVLPPRQRGGGVHAEPKDLGLVAPAGLCRHEGRVDLEEDVVEAGPEVGSVDGGVARRLRVVNVLALGAKELDRLQARVVARPEGQQRVAVAEDPRAASEVALFELVHHLGQAAGGDDVPRVDETIEVAGGFLDGLAHVVVAVEVEDVGDQVQSMLVVVYLGVETREVEPVRDVLFVDLAKVFVSSGRYELWGVRVNALVFGFCGKHDRREKDKAVVLKWRVVRQKAKSKE